MSGHGTGHQQTAQEALWPFGPLARPSYEAQQQLERVAAALAAAEQRGRDEMARKVRALAEELGRYPELSVAPIAARLRALADQAVAS